MKPHIAQYALDLFCITEQGERSKKGGKQRWGEVERDSGREFAESMRERERKREIARKEEQDVGGFSKLLFFAVLCMAQCLARVGGRQRNREREIETPSACLPQGTLQLERTLLLLLPLCSAFLRLFSFLPLF